MERFSKFRDPGTGIQVFLPPVATGNGAIVSTILAPIGWVLGLVRGLGLALTALVYIVLHTTLGQVLPSTDQHITRWSARMALFWLGYVTLPAHVGSVTRKGVRAQAGLPSFAQVEPQAGDLIVSNWSSWVDVLVLMACYAPQFVVPVVAPHSTARGVSATTSAASVGAGPTGSARRAAAPKRESGQALTETGVLGWRIVSGWEVLRSSGHAPSTSAPLGAGRMFPDAVAAAESLAKPDVAAAQRTSAVLFPELVTSNNRALLAPAACFPISWRGFLRVQGHLRLGQGQPNVYLIGLKHPQPTIFSPSAVLSVPDSCRNPLKHAWKVLSSLTLKREVVLRILAPDESPTTPTFSVATVLGPEAAREIVDNQAASRDAVAETCLSLISALVRLRRTRLSWQDKTTFLGMYQS